MLKWIGHQKGAEGIPNIPARELSDEEVKQHGGEKALIATGMYTKPKAERKEKSAPVVEKDK